MLDQPGQEVQLCTCGACLGTHTGRYRYSYETPGRAVEKVVCMDWQALSRCAD